MITYHFDLYPRTDPNGTLLVRFTNLQSAQFRGEANGTGSGEFTIRADDPEADFIDPLGLQYVRVVRDDGATELVVGGFFLERGEYKALDEDETKLLKFGGAGPLTIFQRAVMDADSWIDDPFIGTDPQPNGTWPLHLAGTGNSLGAILWRILHELEEPGRHQNPLPFTSLGFTHLLDSNGAAWVRTTGDFVAQVGDSILSVTRRLMQMGLYVEVDPDTFEVRAYEPETHRIDMTGGSWGVGVVRFQSPTDGTIATGNIKSDASRALEAVVRRNAILTGSRDSWLWVDDLGVTVPWEGGFIVDDEAGTSLLKVGEAQLIARGDAGDTLRLRFKLGDDPANGEYKPFELDGVPLDALASVNTGTGQWDYNEAEFPVAALTVVLRPGGDWDGWADLGATYLSMAERAFQAQSAGGCTCHPPTSISHYFCDGGDCTETFNRTDASDWGTSEILGLAWTEDGSGSAIIHPGRAYLPPLNGSSASNRQILDFTSLDLPSEILMLTELHLPPAGMVGGSGANRLDIEVDVRSDLASTGTGLWRWNITGLDTGDIGGNATLLGGVGDTGSGFVTDTEPFAGVRQAGRLWVRMRCEEEWVRLRAWWDGALEPTTWTIELGPRPSPLSGPRYLVITNRTTDDDLGGDIYVLGVCMVEGASCSNGTCGLCSPTWGQFVSPMLVTVGDGTTMEWTVPFGAYWSGSLTVYVDGILQIPSEMDAAAGTFSLDFAPTAEEQIFAAWRVA